MDLKSLKQTYSLYEKKYKLPSFDKLNEDFEIEKIDRESDTFLRVIRKTIMEKIVNSMNFLEMLLNPVNAPRVYFNFLKGMSLEDKSEIEKIYGLLADLSLKSLSLEVVYDEKIEAELIKESFKIWNSVKPGFSKVLGKVQKPTVNNIRKEKSYFG